MIAPFRFWSIITPKYQGLMFFLKKNYVTNNCLFKLSNNFNRYLYFNHLG